MSQNILIIGATSGIAEAVARQYAKQGANLFLAARNNYKLQVISADLSARGAKNIKTFVLDANDGNRIFQMLDVAWQTFGSFDISLVAHGSLPVQSRTESDITYGISEFRTNAESVITCLGGLAGRLEQQGRGVLAVIGSVAGDRGRASNYLYGAAKAAIDTYASGLRARLFKHGVHVLTIKPGFVATSMTAKLDLPKLLTVSPERVAIDIHNAIARQKDVLYTPWFWYWIMLIIRSVPSAIFKRISI